MTPRFNILVACILFVLILGLMLIPVLSRMSSPQIVINMPKDAQPLESLTPVVSANAKVITSDRAVLYWTVFLEAGKHTTQAQAADLADRAVDKVYGSHP